MKNKVIEMPTFNNKSGHQLYLAIGVIKPAIILLFNYRK